MLPETATVCLMIKMKTLRSNAYFNNLIALTSKNLNYKKNMKTN